MKKLWSIMLICLLVLGTVFSPMQSITGYAKILDDTAGIIRSAAADGIVLLKNEKVGGSSVLPLKPTDKVALFGVGQVTTLAGGGGSANIRAPYVISGLEGMKNAAAEGKFTLVDGLSADYTAYGNAANSDEMEITARQVDNIAKSADTAVIFITRFSREGVDQTRQASAFRTTENNPDGFKYTYSYYLSTKEQNMINLVKNAFSKVAVVLNIPGAVDTSWFANDDKIAAAVSAWYPGMEAGNAIADVLCGKVNPSAKLTVTMAASLDDYLSTDNFGTQETVYKEDIFVGYRQFETFDPTYSKVNYPFGHGLSYTSFSITPNVTVANGKVNVKATVKNTGSVAGREVAQVYFSAPQRNASDVKLSKPGKELAAFGKTKTLAPGESQTLDLSFPVSDMSSYDENGATGHKSAYVLEAGDYKIYVGNSIKNAGENGVKYTYKQGETAVTEQLTQVLSPVTRFMKLEADGKYTVVKAGSDKSKSPAGSDETYAKPDHDILFADVKADKSLVEPFIAQIPSDSLADFLCTSVSFGYPLSKWGVPTSGKTDGPAGIRLPDNESNIQTWYPCAILLASTWDPELVERVGKQLGSEMDQHDVIWAPSMNIHRNPLCGRNFEYYSEDPYISGKIASAMVKGLQSERKCVTLKHFAANNQELSRHANNVVVTERAMREIYLKGFEIAVKESDPWGIMTSYNLINGVHTSERYDLLTTVARGEWGFDGYYTTDWGGYSNVPYKNIIKAGNDLILGHNTYGAPDQLKSALKDGTLKRSEIEVCAKRVLEMMLKTTAADKVKDDAVRISSTGRTRIPAVEYVSASSGVGTEAVKTQDSSGNALKDPVTDLEKQINCMGVGRMVSYKISIDKAGTYDFAVRLSNSPGAEPTPLEFYIDDSSAPAATVPADQIPSTGYFDHTTVYGSINLPAGTHTLSVKAPSKTRNVFNIVDYSFVPSVSVSKDTALKDYSAANFLGQSAYITVDKANLDDMMATDYDEARGLKDGRWVEYTVNIAENAVYTIDTLLKSEKANQTLKIKLDGNDVGAVRTDNSGKYQTQSADLRLPSGKHQIRFACDNTEGSISLVYFGIKFSGISDVESISITQNKCYYIGEDRTPEPLTVKGLTPDGAEIDLTGKEKVEYSSSDESVFRFDGNKLYSRGKNGKSIITVKYGGQTAKMIMTRQDAKTYADQPIAPDVLVQNYNKEQYITTGEPGTPEGGHYDGSALSGWTGGTDVRLFRKSWANSSGVASTSLSERWYDSGYRSMAGWFYDDGNTAHIQGFSTVTFSDSSKFHKEFATDYGYGEFADKWKNAKSWSAYYAVGLRASGSGYEDGTKFGNESKVFKSGRVKGWHQIVSSLEKNAEAEYGWSVFTYLDGELIGKIDIVPETTEISSKVNQNDSNVWATMELRPQYGGGYSHYMDDMILMGSLEKLDTSKLITAAIGENGSVAVNGSELSDGKSVRIEANDDVSIKVTPNSGYEVDEIKLGDTPLTLNASGEASVKMPESDVVLTVTFKARAITAPTIITDPANNYFKTVNGTDTAYVYAKIGDFYNPDLNAEYGMKIWIKGDSAHSLKLPIMKDAQTAAIAVPNTAFSVKVFGPAITSDNTYVFKPYVGSSEGEEMEVSHEDE